MESNKGDFKIALKEDPEFRNINDLAKKLGVTRQTVSRYIGQYMETGIVGNKSAQEIFDKILNGYTAKKIDLEEYKQNEIDSLDDEIVRLYGEIREIMGDEPFFPLVENFEENKDRFIKIGDEYRHGTEETRSLWEKVLALEKRKADMESDLDVSSLAAKHDATRVVSGFPFVQDILGTNISWIMHTDGSGESYYCNDSQLVELGKLMVTGDSRSCRLQIWVKGKSPLAENLELGSVWVTVFVLTTEGLQKIETMECDRAEVSPNRPRLEESFYANINGYFDKYRYFVRINERWLFDCDEEGTGKSNYFDNRYVEGELTEDDGEIKEALLPNWISSFDIPLKF